MGSPNDSGEASNPGIIACASSISAMVGSAAMPGGTIPNRACGAMLGLGVGNLLGPPLEFKSSWEIELHYPKGILHVDQHEKTEPMDDDRAQAVDLGDAIVAAGGDTDSLADDYTERLVIWADENGRGIGHLTGRVIALLELGHPPLEAARLDYEHNPIAPNGGMMRCAPVTVARYRQPELLVLGSAVTCGVTHYSAVCQWWCIILDAVIALLLQGRETNLLALMEATYADDAPDMPEQSQRGGIPEDVLSVIASGPSVPGDCPWLRNGRRLISHTLLAMQAGLWAAVVPLGFETTLREVVESGGDTHTKGANARAVLGARHGSSATPERWLDCVLEQQRIVTLNDSLLALPN